MLNTKTIKEILRDAGIDEGYVAPDSNGATRIIRAMNSDGVISELGILKHWRILLVALAFVTVGLAWMFFSPKNEKPESKKEPAPRFSNEVPHQKK